MLMVLQTNNANDSILTDLNTTENGTIVLWENLEMIQIDEDDHDHFTQFFTF